MSKRKRDAHGEIGKAKSVEIVVVDDFVHIHVTTQEGETICAPLPIEMARDAFSKLPDQLAIKAEGRPT